MNDPYAIIAYEPSTCTTNLHSVPRFGFGTNIADLASGNDKETIKYVKGALIFPILVFAFFIAWFALILWKKLKSIASCTYKIRANGQLRGTYLSRRKAKVLLFALSALSTWACSGLLVGKGSSVIHESADSLLETIMDALVKVQNSLDGTYKIMEVSESIYSVRKLFLDDLLAPCTENGDFLETPAGREFIQLANETYNQLNSLESFFSQDVTDLRADLLVVHSTLSEARDVITSFVSLIWIEKPLLIVLNIAVAAFLCGMIAARMGKSSVPLRRWLAYLLLPLLIITTVIACSGATAAFFVSILNADFCSGTDNVPNPGGSMAEIMKEKGLDDGLMYLIFVYLANNCLANDPLKFILDFAEDEIKTTDRGIVKYLENAISVDIEKTCGIAVGDVENRAQILRSSLRQMHDYSLDTFNGLSCQSIYPLYADVVDDLCLTGMNGAVWIFATLLLVSCSCLTMISLRSERRELSRCSENNNEREEGSFKFKFLSTRSLGATQDASGILDSEVCNVPTKSFSDEEESVGFESLWETKTHHNDDMHTCNYEDGGDKDDAETEAIIQAIEFSNDQFTTASSKVGVPTTNDELHHKERQRSISNCISSETTASVLMQNRQSISQCANDVPDEHKHAENISDFAQGTTISATNDANYYSDSDCLSHQRTHHQGTLVKKDQLLGADLSIEKNNITICRGEVNSTNTEDVSHDNLNMSQNSFNDSKEGHLSNCLQRKINANPENELVTDIHISTSDNNANYLRSDSSADLGRGNIEENRSKTNGQRSPLISNEDEDLFEI